MSSFDAATSKIRLWREHPVQFVRDNFGVEPDLWQVDALHAFTSYDLPRLRISLQACAGPGKSAVLAWFGWLFLSCYGDKLEHPKGAALSVSGDNLKDNLWAELAKWQEQSAFLKGAFTWTKERIFANDHPKTWFLAARSWSKDANPEEQGKTLSGLHSKYVLILVDESGTIPITVLKKGEQALSTASIKFGRIVQAGNPTSRDGMLYAAATHLAHQWKVIRITGDPDDPKRSPRIDVDWAREQIKTHGRGDPWVMGHILGEFPEGGLNTLLSPDDVEKAMTRVLRDEDFSHIQKRLGLDCARYGDDSTVIFPRQGLQAFKYVEMRGANGPQVAGRVIAAKATWNHELVFFDGGGGYGASVEDSLVLAGQPPIAVYGSGAPNDKRYFNKRAECWWEMALWVKRGGALPYDQKLKRQLTTPQYYLKDGRLKIEDKDQIKKRLGFSPDHADALSNTFYMPDAPAALVIPGQGPVRPKHETDWNPLVTTSAATEWNPLG